MAVEIPTAKFQGGVLELWPRPPGSRGDKLYQSLPHGPADEECFGVHMIMMALLYGGLPVLPIALTTMLKVFTETYPCLDSLDCMG